MNDSNASAGAMNTEESRWTSASTWNFPGVGWAKAGEVLKAGMSIVLAAELLLLPAGLYRDLSNPGIVPFLYTGVALVVLWSAVMLGYLPSRWVMPWAALFFCLFGAFTAVDFQSPVVGLMFVNVAALLVFWAGGSRPALPVFLVPTAVLLALHEFFISPLGWQDSAFVVASVAFFIPHTLVISAYLSHANRTLDRIDLLESSISSRAGIELRTVGLLARDLRHAASSMAIMFDPGFDITPKRDDIDAAIRRMDGIMGALDEYAGAAPVSRAVEVFNIDTMMEHVAWVLSPVLASSGITLGIDSPKSGIRDFRSDRIRIRNAMLSLARMGQYLFGAQRIEMSGYIYPAVGDLPSRLILDTRVLGPVITLSALESLLNATSADFGADGVVWSEFRKAKQSLAALGADINIEQRMTHVGEREVTFSIDVAISDRADEAIDSIGERDEGLQSCLHQQSVLVVEDDPITRRATVNMLERHMGAIVDAVSTVADALRLLAERHYRMVLSDYILGGANGDDLLITLRERGDATPVIITTASAVSREVLLLRELGAAGILAKPINQRDLEVSAESVLATETLAAREHVDV